MQDDYDPLPPRENPFIRREKARTKTDHGVRAEKRFAMGEAKKKS
jgi:hypothetical protein